MKKITVFFLFFAIFCMFFKMFADDDEDKLRLAVMEFEDKSGKLSAGTLSNATEYIRGAFVASNKFIVIAKERQENAMIKQMKKESYKACNDKNCQIPLGQALSADTILRTTITFFAKKYTITSELIDLEKEATTKGAKATFNGSEESLSKALDSIVSQIISEKNQNRNEIQNSQDKQACEYAKKSNNIKTWEMYLKKFPNGECVFEAEATIENLKKNEENRVVKAEKNESEKPVNFGNLQWSKKSSDTMDWDDAINYCKNLKEGGHSDWHLPNIDELRTLIQNSPKTATGGLCKVSEKGNKLSGSFDPDCYGDRSDKNYSKLNDKGRFWSKSIVPNSTYHYDHRWFVDFTSAEIGSIEAERNYWVRCVR